MRTNSLAEKEDGSRITLPCKRWERHWRTTRLSWVRKRLCCWRGISSRMPLKMNCSTIRITKSRGRLPNPYFEHLWVSTLYRTKRGRERSWRSCFRTVGRTWDLRWLLWHLRGPSVRSNWWKLVGGYRWCSASPAETLYWAVWLLNLPAGLMHWTTVCYLRTSDWWAYILSVWMSESP